MDAGLGSGRYRGRVTIEQPTPALNAAGQDQPTWSTLIEVWADVATIHAREHHTAYQRRAVRGFNFRVRRSSETVQIAPTHRVIWSGKTLQIQWAARLLEEVEFTAFEVH